jgi:hypothetical protein
MVWKCEHVIHVPRPRGVYLHLPKLLTVTHNDIFLYLDVDADSLVIECVEMSL